MATNKNQNVEEITDEEMSEPTEEEMEEIEAQMEEEDEDTREEAFEDQLALQEEYGAPEGEEKQNAHLIIGKAIDRADTVRTTFLTESELGRPLFSVRFLSDLHDDAKRHDLKRIEAYYWEKIQNITSSGMSNKGFTMNLNVTQKRDTTRKRVRELPANFKDGKK